MKNTVGEASRTSKETAATDPVDHELPAELVIQLLESWKRAEVSSPVSECPVLLGAVGGKGWW